MWLPETAVNDPTLDLLIEQGLRYVILSPEQAAAVREPAGIWQVPGVTGIDSSRAYRYLHRDDSGRSLAVFFYDGPLARGIAFDGGYGLTEVLFSEDGGKNWRAAQLGKDLGKYSFREWTAPFTPSKPGAYELKVKATNRIGQSQPMEALWNPPGYMRNVVETVKVNAG